VQAELSQDGQAHDPHEGLHPLQLAQAQQRAERIGPHQIKLASMFDRQRLRQDKVAVHRVEQGQATGQKEGPANVNVAKHASQDRAQDEAQPEHRPQQSVVLDPIFGLADVSDVGVGHRHIGTQCAAHETHGQQHPEGTGQGGDKEVDRHAHQPEQEHRTATITIRQGTQNGCRKELRNGKNQLRGTVGKRGARTGVHERPDELGQHRDDESDRHHVEQNCHHDEWHGRLAAACRTHWHPVSGSERRPARAKAHHSMR
jgi:hypothetical protein